MNNIVSDKNKKQRLTPVLSITGSDSTGVAGIQADIRTISDLGGFALTAITSVAVQDSKHITSVTDMATELVVSQTRTIISDIHPQAVKIGLVRDVQTIRELRNEVIGCRNIVCDPGIISSRGYHLIDTEAREAFKRYLLPISTLLIMRCNEAELLTGIDITTNDDMLSAAKALIDMGAGNIMLRGGYHTEGTVTALLLCSDGEAQYFTSPNTEGWKMHGVGGALSTAIATRLALGDDIRTAISNAHIYIRRQVVYSAESASQSLRHIDLYNQLMSLIAGKYKEAHDVTYYAEALNVTTRYLSQITKRVADKSPRQIIADYIMHEAEMMLTSSVKNMQEISIELGFTSQAAFTKFFHQQKGSSPSEWRKK